MVRLLKILIVGWMVLFVPSLCFAHFGMVIPSTSMVDQDHRTLGLTMSFSHPFEGNGMELVQPKKMGVYVGGTYQNLLPMLKKTLVFGHTAWKTSYAVKRPGVYSFVMEPHPYWEPAEDSFIIHYTKTIVAAFGEEDGWDKPLGLKTEIVPLTRPFGLYAGNVFQGQVLVDGKPAPNTSVEIEYYNKDKKAVAPSEYMITQVVKVDPNGIFTVALPHAGWWGFAGLNAADFTLKHDGKPKEVELGAVLWVNFTNWQEK